MVVYQQPAERQQYQHAASRRAPEPPAEWYQGLVGHDYQDTSHHFNNKIVPQDMPAIKPADPPKRPSQDARESIGMAEYAERLRRQQSQQQPQGHVIGEIPIAETKMADATIYENTDLFGKPVPLNPFALVEYIQNLSTADVTTVESNAAYAVRDHNKSARVEDDDDEVDGLNDPHRNREFSHLFGTPRVIPPFKKKTVAFEKDVEIVNRKRKDMEQGPEFRIRKEEIRLPPTEAADAAAKQSTAPTMPILPTYTSK